MSNKSRKKLRYVIVINEKRRIFSLDDINFIVAETLNRMEWYSDAVKPYNNKVTYLIKTAGYEVKIIIRENPKNGIIEISLHFYSPINLDIPLIPIRKLLLRFHKIFDRVILSEIRRRQ